MESSGESSVAELSRQLLLIARTQGEVLEAGDFDAFNRLSDERDTLTETLDLSGRYQMGPLEQALLRETAAQDDRNVSLIRRLMLETNLNLQQVRHGRVALHGYSGPTTRSQDFNSLVDSSG